MFKNWSNLMSSMSVFSRRFCRSKTGTNTPKNAAVEDAGFRKASSQNFLSTRLSFFLRLEKILTFFYYSLHLIKKKKDSRITECLIWYARNVTKTSNNEQKVSLSTVGRSFDPIVKEYVSPPRVSKFGFELYPHVVVFCSSKCFTKKRPRFFVPKNHFVFVNSRAFVSSLTWWREKGLNETGGRC